MSQKAAKERDGRYLWMGMNPSCRDRHKAASTFATKGASVRKAWLLMLMLATPAWAQDISLTEGFAEGFTFHSIFASGHRVDSDGAVVYARNGGGNTHIAAVRPGAAPCVFISSSLNLNEGIKGTPTVMLEETYDLRNASFVADAKHQWAPPGGVYLTLKAPNVLCKVSTSGEGGKLTRTAQCEDRFEATIEQPMMPAFTATAAKLKALCKWK